MIKSFVEKLNESINNDNFSRLRRLLLLDPTYIGITKPTYNYMIDVTVINNTIPDVVSPIIFNEEVLTDEIADELSNDVKNMSVYNQIVFDILKSDEYDSYYNLLERCFEELKINNEMYYLLFFITRNINFINVGLKNNDYRCAIYKYYTQCDNQICYDAIINKTLKHYLVNGNDLCIMIYIHSIWEIQSDHLYLFKHCYKRIYEQYGIDLVYYHIINCTDYSSIIQTLKKHYDDKDELIKKHLNILSKLSSYSN